MAAFKRYLLTLQLLLLAGLAPNIVADDCVTTGKCKEKGGKCVFDCKPGAGQKCKANWCDDPSEECACLITKKCPQ